MNKLDIDGYDESHYSGGDGFGIGDDQTDDYSSGDGHGDGNINQYGSPQYIDGGGNGYGYGYGRGDGDGECGGSYIYDLSYDNPSEW